MRHLLLLSCLALLLAGQAAEADEVALLPHVAINDDLMALKSTAYTTVVRDGFYTPGDGGGATYTSSNVPCSLNGGLGDDGSQVKAANAGCWILDFPAAGVDMRVGGSRIDGVTNDSVPANALLLAATIAGTERVIVPANGKCMIAQLTIPGSVLLRGSAISACVESPANATGATIEWKDAYLHLQRTVTNVVTQLTANVPVSDVAGVSTTCGSGGPCNSIFVMGDDGVGYTAVQNGAPSGSVIPVDIGTWSGVFTASTGNWWGNLNDTGPANVQIEDLTVDPNAAAQSAVNNNVVNAQPVTAGNLALVGGTPTFSPRTNLYLEFWSASNISAVTFTVTCDLIRQDSVATSVSFTVVGPTAGSVARGATPKWCHKVTQISAGGTIGGATVTVGAAEGALANDGIVIYGAMPRLKNVIVNRGRGWGVRTGFVPGTGFVASGPDGNVLNQEAYFDHLQLNLMQAGGLWMNGPNDSRVDGVVVGFTGGLSVWVDRLCGGCNFSHIHASGGNTGLAVGLVEQLYGFVDASDTVTCIECKLEESKLADVLVLANSSIFKAAQVFYQNPAASNRVGFQLGDTDYNTGTPITGYNIEGEAKRYGTGAIKFINDGGRGFIKMNVFNDGPYTGALPYNGFPLSCTSGGSFITLLDGVTLANLYKQNGPCPPWTPSMQFGGVAPAQTSAGEWQGNIAQGRITLTANPAIGAVTITGLPSGLQPIQTCQVVVSFTNNVTGLTGSLNGYLQGGTITVFQWVPGGTAGIIEAAGPPSPFVNGSNFYFTAGPCVQ